MAEVFIPAVEIYWLYTLQKIIDNYQNDKKI
jgi:hypothetical protein